MSESLRDQLLKSGLAAKFKPEPRPAQPARPAQKSSPPNRQGQRPQGQRPPRPQQGGAEMDLAKAYALRDKNEREQREREQRAAEQRARERKERKQKLATLLGGKALNDAGAEIPRHFPHANKIRRIYVTGAQLPQLNNGELAVVQLAGRYLLVAKDVGLAAQAIDPDALVLLSDSQSGDDDDVPADLVW